MSFRVPSRVLLDDAATVLRQGALLIAAGEREVDLAEVMSSDSSLVACLLAWRRAAQAAGGTVLSVTHASARVRGLAALYGVEQIALD